jgi:heme-degrading monooxygenase HmoA
MSHVIVWEFVVREGCEREFEEAYGSKGAWATLFAQSPEHLGVELLRDTAAPRRYVTIDRWISNDSFARFKQEHGAAYEALDARCETWTEKEGKIGLWTTP